MFCAWKVALGRAAPRPSGTPRPPVEADGGAGQAVQEPHGFGGFADLCVCAL